MGPSGGAGGGPGSGGGRIGIGGGGGGLVFDLTQPEGFQQEQLETKRATQGSIHVYIY